MQLSQQIKNKRIYLILGTARSGTSVIARAMHTLGIDLGDKLTPPNDNWNPKGFWEDTEIVYQITGEILNILQSGPYQFHLFEKEVFEDPCFKEVREKAINILEERFQNKTAWGFKDPSSIKILPFWQAIFKSHHIQENYIIALRHPFESAKSYSQLTQSDIEIGLILWLIHVYAAIERTHDNNRTIVSYTRIIEHPYLQLQRINTQLKLHLEINANELSIFANEFLDKKLYHNKNSDIPLTSPSSKQIAILCLQIYELLMQVADDKLGFQENAFNLAWHKIKTNFEFIYPIYEYIGCLRKHNLKLERSLRKADKSFSAKLIYPLQLLENSLRNWHYQYRKNRKFSRSFKN